MEKTLVYQDAEQKHTITIQRSTLHRFEEIKEKVQKYVDDMREHFFQTEGAGTYPNWAEEIELWAGSGEVIVDVDGDFRICGKNGNKWFYLNHRNIINL